MLISRFPRSAFVRCVIAAGIVVLMSPVALADSAPATTASDQSGDFVRFYTYFAWIVLPMVALVVSTVLMVRAFRDKLHRRVEFLEDALKRSQNQRDEVKETLARREAVLRKLSLLTLVDQVSAASRDGQTERQSDGDQTVSLPS